MTHIRLPPRGRSLARESSTAVPGEPALPLQLLELQRHHGNQAVLRFVAAQAPPARLLQRTITIMPAHYARGLGVTPATLSDAQLSEYLRMAVDDDVEWARQRAHEVETTARSQRGTGSSRWRGTRTSRCSSASLRSRA